MDEYNVIKEIERNPFHTQRSLAESLHVSLGKANYMLSGLVEKGLIKARKLKNHPERIRWQYVLTTKGIQEKIGLTKSYLERRLREFDALQLEIDELRKEAQAPQSRDSE